MTDDYAELRRAVEGAGFFTTLRAGRSPPDRMVCASHRCPQGHARRGLFGNSF